MRGPGYKLTGDVRRTWRCPKCGLERKLQGQITTLICGCNEGTWMQIVSERTMEPRPSQRPSDIERRPIDFGIEAPPPAPAKPEATIIKGAISPEFESVQESSAGEPEATTSVAEAKPQATLEDKPKPEQKPKAKHKDSPKAMPEGHTQAKPDVDPQPQVEDDWGEGIL